IPISGETANIAARGVFVSREVMSDTLASSEIVREFWSAPPAPLNEAETAAVTAEIRALLQQEDAVLVAHYYTDPAIQALAEATGGCVPDSLERSRLGRDHKASTLMVAGVRYMGETAKTLRAEKRVLMPTLEASCSLDLGCPAEEYAAFCGQHSVRTVV